MYVRRPLPPSSDPTQPLNRSEWAYMAIDGPLGSLTQAYIYRFAQRVSLEAVRQAFWRMLVAFPRLRAVAEPTPRRYQVRILPVDEQLEHLFGLAIREDRIDLDDPQALLRWHELAMNDVMPVQRGLGWRVQFVDHPTRPALMLCAHHLLVDGRSLVHITESLMKLLNGLPIEDLPLEETTLLPAVFPLRWRDWPAKLWAGWRHQRQMARELASLEVIRLPHRRAERHAGAGVQHLDTGCSAKALSQVARQMGGSSNSLLIAALGTALLRQAGGRPGTAARIRLSVDLRRYYPAGQAPVMGNCVAIFDLLLPQSVPELERVRWVDTQVREHLGRFERREMVWPLLPFEILGRVLSTHSYMRLYRRSRRLDQLPALSAHTTNIGSVDAFNAPDAQVRLTELYPSIGGAAPLLVFLVVDGRQVIVTSHQRNEYRDADMQAAMQAMSQVLQGWVNPGPTV